MDHWSVSFRIVDPCLFQMKLNFTAQDHKELNAIVSKLEKDVEAWNTVSCGVLPGQAKLSK